MSKDIFVDLLQQLVESHGLKGSRSTTAREVLAITINIMAHNMSMRECMERFQHSTETISRYFSRCLTAIIKLSQNLIAPVDGQFTNTPAKILNDDRYMPYFKDCIGAIDGTHVDARIPVDEQVPYIGRHGYTSQNIMAVCDFDMTFTFVMAGWEGSAHDSRIFHSAITDRRWNFPHPPAGNV
ncbi:hypothetical protein KSP39_PZI019369 [Platanthera zijinensis]|uniref:DDE Tnp4 domain-containing protein n=1 Tax=Platanthera zijinensis TaxID=2320716 RepID=A0AAP0B2P8_9ASPA